MRKRIVNTKERKGGVALIISVGILALLAMIATSFAINMQLEYKAAINQLNYTKATVLAEAGIEKVMADIRYKAKTSAYDTVVATYGDGYTTGEVDLGDGSYEVTIEREDEKVNINALDETDYPWISRLKNAGLSNNEIAKIIDYRDSDSNVTTQILTSGTGSPQVATGDETNAKNAPYATVEELRIILNDNNKYDAVKDIVTISAPIIRGGLIGKYYLDRASFSKESILNLSHYKGKVIELGKIMEMNMPGSDGDNWGWSESHDAEFAGAYLVVDEFGIEKFGVIWTGFIYIPEDKVGQSIAFYTRSNEGVRLFIDGEKIIDDWQEGDWMEGTPGIRGNKIFTYSGWHPIRIDYFDVIYENGCELRWDGLGSIAHVPAEYLGYHPPSYAGPANLTTTATETTYNSAGFYKITSTGKIKAVTGDVLAQKKISTQTRIFGSWTQTTRAEFYAPWFSTYNNFSDGEILNVTWLDSCPTSEGISPNALKLGFWDNFDEDPGYTVVNLVGNHTSWDHFQEQDSDGNREFSLTAEAYGCETTEINAYYYYMDNRTNYDLFARAEERDSQSPTQRVVEAWDVGWLHVKRISANQGQTNPAFNGENNSEDYYTLLKDEFSPYHDHAEWVPSYVATDKSELSLGVDWAVNPEDNHQVPYTYKTLKFLGATGIGTNYKAYIDDQFTGAEGDKMSNNAGCIVLEAFNCSSIEWPRDQNPKQYLPINSPLDTYWDDVRIIPGQGKFISAPFSEIPEMEAGEVEWGYISWNGTGSGVSLEGRSAASLAGFSSAWGSWGASYSASGGQALNLNNAKFFQYKVVMTDNNHDGTAPVFKDVTITYLPSVEVLYLRSEVE